MKKIRFIFAWYDLWVGVFYDKGKNLVYIFPLPMFGIVLDFNTYINIGGCKVRKHPEFSWGLCDGCGEPVLLEPEVSMHDRCWKAVNVNFKKDEIMRELRSLTEGEVKVIAEKHKKSGKSILYVKDKMSEEHLKIFKKIWDKLKD